MTILERRIPLGTAAAKRSLFLFGPRQTGKTTLLRTLFRDAPFYNLLLSDVFFRLSTRPSSLREDRAARPQARIPSSSMKSRSCR